MSRPLRSGMFMSSTRRSHSPRCRQVSVSLPEADSPISAEGSDWMRNCRKPARNKAWSSAMSTRAILTPRIVLARQPGIAIQLVIQRFDAAPQDPRSAALVTGKTRQRRLDDRALHVAETRADSYAQLRVAPLLLCRGGQVRRAPDRRAQIDLAVRQDVRVLDRVLELADITGPAVPAGGIERTARVALLAVRYLIHALEKKLRQLDDVIAPLAQRRQLDREDRDPV